jgi:hypothetical protein
MVVRMREGSNVVFTSKINLQPAVDAVKSRLLEEDMVNKTKINFQLQTAAGAKCRCSIDVIAQ